MNPAVTWVGKTAGRLVPDTHHRIGASTIERGDAVVAALLLQGGDYVGVVVYFRCLDPVLQYLVEKTALLEGRRTSQLRQQQLEHRPEQCV